MSDLELPFNAIIPYSVQIDKNLSSSEKLFFGQICGLARKTGYMWATDQQFSEMTGIPLPTIEKWLRNLSDNGHIKRVTHNELVKGSNGKKSHFLKRRKIYILQKIYEDPAVDGQPKIDQSSGTIENDGSKGVIKNDGYKSKSLSSISKQQPETPPAISKTPSAVVVPSAKEDPDPFSFYDPDHPVADVIVPSLDQLDIEHNLKLKISSQHSAESVDKAVDRCLKWHSRPSDVIGIMTCLKKADEWKDNPTKEEKELKNLEFLKTLENLDGKTLGMSNVTVGNKYIEFVCGLKVVVFNIESNDFKKDVKEYLDYLRMLEKV